MERVLTSRRFLGATVFCCGLAVALSLWVVGDATGGARALAALIGLGASLAVMLLIAWALADEAEPRAVPAPPPAVVPPAIPEPPAAAPGALARCLDEGRALRDELEPGSADPRVEAWIGRVREALDGCSPGVAGYFNALARRTYADEGAKLEAHIGRLETIVRDVS